MGSGSVSLPCAGYFSPFPHGTGSLSVSREYLALPDGPGGFSQDSSCPAILRMPLCFHRFRVRSFHALWRRFPAPSPRLCLAMSWSYNPAGAVTPAVWALPRSLATTGGITFCFLLLRVMRCFSSPRSPALLHDRHLDGRVAPFGNPRVKGYLHLAVAYRGLSRPSSPPRA